MHEVSNTEKMLYDKYGITMTADQIKEVLGLNKDTVLRMLQRQDIIARKAGSRWIIATESVAEYLTSGEPSAEIKVLSKTRGKKLIV
jgi:excisionase family DNA binding protein